MPEINCWIPCSIMGCLELIIDLEVDNKEKMKLMDKCGEIEFRMTEGSDEFIQLEAMLASVTLAGSK